MEGISFIGSANSSIGCQTECGRRTRNDEKHGKRNCNVFGHQSVGEFGGSNSMSDRTGLWVGSFFFALVEL